MGVLITAVPFHPALKFSQSPKIILKNVIEAIKTMLDRTFSPNFLSNFTLCLFNS